MDSAGTALTPSEWPARSLPRRWARAGKRTRQSSGRYHISRSCATIFDGSMRAAEDRRGSEGNQSARQGTIVRPSVAVTRSNQICCVRHSRSGRAVFAALAEPGLWTFLKGHLPGHNSLIDKQLRRVILCLGGPRFSLTSSPDFHRIQRGRDAAATGVRRLT